MPRLFQPTLAAILVLAVTQLPAAAQDNPILRARLTQMIKEELVQHDSQATAWLSEKSVDRQKWTSGKLLGRKVRLASWTEQSKVWVWLEDPRSLEVELTQLALRDGRIEFALRARTKARFRAWGRIPNLAKGSVGGTMDVDLELAGSAAIGVGRLERGKITLLVGHLNDLRFNNRLGRPYEDLVKDALNDYAQDKNEKLRRSIEKAIDRVKF